MEKAIALQYAFIAGFIVLTAMIGWVAGSTDKQGIPTIIVISLTPFLVGLVVGSVLVNLKVLEDEVLVLRIACVGEYGIELLSFVGSRLRYFHR